MSSGEVREVIVGQDRSGECRRGQEIPGKSGDVGEGFGIYGRSGEFRGVKWRSMDIRRVQGGLGCLLKRKKIKGYSNQVENKVLNFWTIVDFF